MRKILITSCFTLIVGVLLGYFLAPKYTYHVQDIYFDAEGNEIPNEVVQLFVTSQFVEIDSTEQNTLSEYFYK